MNRHDAIFPAPQQGHSKPLAEVQRELAQMLGEPVQVYSFLCAKMVCENSVKAKLVGWRFTDAGAGAVIERNGYRYASCGVDLAEAITRASWVAMWAGGGR